MNKMFVPVNIPWMDGNEKAYIIDCLESGWVSNEGKYVAQFESSFSSYIGRRFGVAVSSGSAALDIAVQAIGISRGDEVIMPTFTIISPALSVVRAGGVPILVDSDPVTWNIDVEQIESKITKRTKAIIVVHIYGLPVDMDPVLELCTKHNLVLIEDAAEMNGQTYKGRKCGTFGTMSVFSFYANKHITTGEGGMILTDDQDLSERCRKLRNLAFEPAGRRFVHHELGWNYRMTNMQAAIGVGQLERISTHLEKKRAIGAAYNVGLQGVSRFLLPLAATHYADNIYCFYGLVAESETLCQQTVSALAQSGVDTRPFFWCMHEQPVFKQMGLFNGQRYPHAESLARKGFYLPCGLGLTNDQIEYVIKIFMSIAL